MHVCFFEDAHSSDFLPLTYFHPVYDLRCGIFSLRERCTEYLRPSSVFLHSRQYLREILGEENPGAGIHGLTGDDWLLINGRCLMTAGLARTLGRTKSETLFVGEGGIVAARLRGRNVAALRDQLAGEAVDLSQFDALPQVKVDAALVDHSWDLIYANENTLVTDFVQSAKRKQRSGRTKIHRSVVLLNRKQIRFGAGSLIDPGVVLDARPGPIHIGRNVRIFPHAVIEGPAAIGDGSVIKVGAKIYGNTSIGKVCKVGGEVEHSILHSYANKQHDGFLGHSYVGMWVNLGAGTTTSNLKNTYGTVKAFSGGQLLDTGRMFLGLVAGDHVKTGINLPLDTGTVIGPSSNIYGSALPPKFVPSFSWGDAASITTYDAGKAADVAVRVMARRNVTASDAYRRLFLQVFSLSAHERTDHRH